jgi:16S rRNA (adenine1518-N6/adenine1519-N6)-dimethyltransferase
VLQIDVHLHARLAGSARNRFFEIVRAAFSQRRKRLPNALAASLDQPKETVEHLLRQAGVAPDRRAETLTVDDWLAVERVFAEREHADH